MATTGFGNCLKVVGCVVLFALPAASQWRTGYFMDNNASGQRAQTIPWSKYTHVIHYALKPTFIQGKCGWDTSDTSINESSISDFVNSAHTAGVKALIGVSEDRSLAAIRTCTMLANLPQFASLISDFVKDHGYDGVDIEWGSGILYTPYEIQYQDLIRGLRSAMPTAILTVPVSIANSSFTAPVADYLDQINLMAYGLDIYNLGDATSNSAEHRLPSVQQIHTLGNAMDYALQDQLSRIGTASTKVGLGVSFYGVIEQGCLESTGSIGTTDPNHTSLHDISRQLISYRDLVASPYWTAGTHVWDDLQESQFIRYTGAVFVSRLEKEWLDTMSIA